MTTTCTGYLGDGDGAREWLCYRCLKGASVLFVLVEDGHTDDEQYVCEACAHEVAMLKQPLGHLRLGPKAQ